MPVGPAFTGVARTQINGVGPVFTGTAAFERERSVGNTFQGVGQSQSQGAGPVWQGDAEAIRGFGVGPAFGGDAEALRGFGVGPTFVGTPTTTEGPPAIESLSPPAGLSIGEDCVTIRGLNFALRSAGGFVRVYFDDELVLEGGSVDSETILVLTPPGELGVKDVRVENWTSGDPDVLTGSSTLVGGFEYQLPQIESNRNLQASQDDAILVVTRQLVKELRRTVLANVHHDMHPEYVDDVSAGQGQEKQSSAPNLKVTGPSVSEDRFYSINGRFDLETVEGFNVFNQPTTFRLDYRYVGVGRTKAEAINLHGALTLFLNRTIFLTIPKDGDDPANGSLAFELNPTWTDRAEFTETNRQGFYQFSGEFHLRGVHAVSRPVCPGRKVVECVITVEQDPSLGGP